MGTSSADLGEMVYRSSDAEMSRAMTVSAFVVVERTSSMMRRIMDGRFRCLEVEDASWCCACTKRVDDTFGSRGSRVA